MRNCLDNDRIVFPALLHAVQELNPEIREDNIDLAIRELADVCRSLRKYKNGELRTQDGKFPVDSSGTLPDGRSFSGPQELKVILKADRDAFARGLTEKLLTYALGRGLERYDRPVVKKIATRVAANDYRFSSLTLEIVNSLPFQYRKSLFAPAPKEAGKLNAKIH